MNKRVILTMIHLVLIYLCAWYILKFAFPNVFMLQVNNAHLITVGEYIDNHIWLRTMLGFGTAFLTYWLYLCATLCKPSLNVYQCFIVVCVIAFAYLVNEISLTASTYYCIIVMIALPTIYGASMKNTACVFIAHLLAQWFSLEIRGLSKEMLSTNFLSLFIMTLECYFWLLLFYLYYNYREKEGAIYEN